MGVDFSMIDLSKLKHWQVMDPAPEFIQLLNDPVLIAQVIKVQADYKEQSIKLQTKALVEYYANVKRILDNFIEGAARK